MTQHTENVYLFVLDYNGVNILTPRTERSNAFTASNKGMLCCMETVTFKTLGIL